MLCVALLDRDWCRGTRRPSRLSARQTKVRGVLQMRPSGISEASGAPVKQPMLRLQHQGAAGPGEAIGGEVRAKAEETGESVELRKWASLPLGWPAKCNGDGLAPCACVNIYIYILAFPFCSMGSEMGSKMGSK